MSDREKLRAVMEELLKTQACCSCCSGDSEYLQIVQRVAKIAGFKISVKCESDFPGEIVKEKATRLSPAQKRLLVAASEGTIKPRGSEWRSIEKLLRLGLVGKVVNEATGCCLGEFRATARGLEKLRFPV